MAVSALQVLYEDNHLLVLNKPAGVLVQGDRTGDEPLAETAKQYVKEKYHKPGKVFLGVVHRLDRPVSGVVVFARTSKALSRMNALFRSRQTKKIYLAVVKNEPVQKEGTLVHWLKKSEEKNKAILYTRETPGALRCVVSGTAGIAAGGATPCGGGGSGAGVRSGRVAAYRRLTHARARSCGRSSGHGASACCTAARSLRLSPSSGTLPVAWRCNISYALYPNGPRPVRRRTYVAARLYRSPVGDHSCCWNASGGWYHSVPVPV